MRLSGSIVDAEDQPITLASLPKALIHVDCDAFFASVEQALNPDLKGRPVITGKERGIAASMSYEAKRRGVVRGMRLSEIRKICPDCVLLPSDYETYSLVSKRLFGILRRFTPEVEEYSIDEAFADLSGLRRVYRTSYEDIAWDLKQAVQKELGITVSVGLSLTKSLAKIASRHCKPDGFTVVKGYDLHHFLKDVPPEEVCGFGPNTVNLLRKNGIQTVWDFTRRPLSFAKKLLGKIGSELWHELRGEPIYSVETGAPKPQVTLSKVKTFTPSSGNKAFVRAQLLRNLESAFIKLRRHHLRAWTVGICLRDHEYRSDGLVAGLNRPTASTLEAAPVAAALFEKVFRSGLKYRQSGVFLSHLESEGEVQLDLFEDPCRIKNLRKLSEVTDQINALYGKHTLHMASTTSLEGFRQHLGERGDLAGRKKQLLKGETFRQRLKIPVWNVKI